jgi:hypothetical protein
VWLQSLRRPLILAPCCHAAPSNILEGHRPCRSVDSFFRAVRVFLSGLVDSSAFQEVSLGREVSIVFTSNGPLIYRWEANNAKPRAVKALGSITSEAAPQTNEL